MKLNIIAIRYARALIKLTGVEASVVDANAEAFALLKVLFEIKEAKTVLKSPVMPNNLKSELIHLVLTKLQPSPVFFNFIEVVLQARRVHLLPEIGLAYRMLVDEARNVVHAQVSSAEEWSDEYKASLTETLAKVLSKTVISNFESKPSLLGGFIVRTGNYLIDCSLKTKIDVMISNAAAISGA